MLRAEPSTPLRVRDLAQRCAISEATFFNYFMSREALIGEVAHSELDALCAEAGANGGSLRKVLRDVCVRLRSAFVDEPVLWHRIWSSARASDPSLGGPGGRDPEAPSGGLGGLVARAQARGEVRSDLSAGLVADALANAWLGALSSEVQRLQSQAAPLEHEAFARIQATVELVLDGSRKRNERVRINREETRGVVAPARVATEPPPGT